MRIDEMGNKTFSAARSEPKKRHSIHRVLFIDHTGQLGGAEFNLCDLAMHLPTRNTVVLLSNGPFVEYLQKRNIRTYCISDIERLVSLGKETPLLTRFSQFPLFIRTVRWLGARAREADIVCANTKKSILFAALAARLTNRPMIWLQQDPIYHPLSLSPRERISETLLIRILNRSAVKIISVSRSVAETFIAAGGRPDLPVVIHTGLDPGPFLENVDAVAVRRELRVPEDQLLIGCFGRLSPWKGQKVLLDALPQVPRAHAVFVGGAIFGESSYENQLKEHSYRLGLAERVHFLGFKSNVPRLMAAMDLIVHPSTELDPCPRVVLEALHSCKPLVATRMGGVPELVENGKTGLLVPPGNPDSLATALRSLIEDPKLALNLAQAGRRRAMEEFVIERTVSGIEEVFLRCLDRRSNKS